MNSWKSFKQQDLYFIPYLMILRETVPLSFKAMKKCLRILKWKAGVNIFMNCYQSNKSVKYY